MKHLEYPYVIAIFMVFLSLANANVENVFSQGCEVESTLPLADCNDNGNDGKLEKPTEGDYDSKIPMILPFP